MMGGLYIFVRGAAVMAFRASKHRTATALSLQQGRSEVERQKKKGWKLKRLRQLTRTEEAVEAVNQSEKRGRSFEGN